MLLLDRAKQEKVNFIGETSKEETMVVNEVDGLEGQEELCFVNANGTCQGASSNSPSTGSNVEAMFKQLLDAQARSEKNIGYELKNIHTKIDGSYNELNNKFKALENQFDSFSSTSSRQTGSLPGKSEQNPKETMKAITLRSYRELPTRVLIKDNESQVGEVIINVDDDVVIVDEKTNEEILEKIVEVKGKGKLGEEKKDLKNNEESTSPKRAPFSLPSYEPKLHFPGRFKKQLLEQYKALFDKQMSEVHITMPIIDAFMLVPQYSKFLKDAVTKKKEMEGMRCLCDLGASVSLMPLSIAKKIGFTQYKKCRISLVLADRSVKLPIGILEDLPVMIGNCEVPTGFVVLEMDEEPKDPLILGRPFLATAGAIVNVRDDKIDLNLGKRNTLHFDVKEVMKKPTIQGQIFYVEEMDALAEVQLVQDEVSKVYGKMMNSHLESIGEDKFMMLPLNTGHATTAVVQTESRDADWSELKAPKIDLKPLPSGLRYAFLGLNDTYPVIVNSDLDEHELLRLLGELKRFRRAI
ncbi:hypothetical protein N665_1100s0003 [Sinapis alba]|nr:hypothetical protein N665_1100s0003 [Sinapis alba]